MNKYKIIFIKNGMKLETYARDKEDLKGTIEYHVKENGRELVRVEDKETGEILDKGEYE